MVIGHEEKRFKKILSKSYLGKMNCRLAGGLWPKPYTKPF